LDEIALISSKTRHGVLGFIAKSIMAGHYKVEWQFRLHVKLVLLAIIIFGENSLKGERCE
jgi:hypothetical protein